MIKDPWTDPDPQPGDFDAYLKTVAPEDVEVHAGTPGARIEVISAEEAERLRRGPVADDARAPDALSAARRRSR